MAQKKTTKPAIKKPIQQKKIIAEEKQRKNIFYLGIIAALVFILYLPTLNYEFTHNDDTALVKDNHEFLSDPSSIPTIFSQSVFYNTFKVTDTYYRPVLTLSYFIDTQIAGKNYWFFYLTDLLLHLACCLMLYFILIKLSFDRLRSFLFTALFAVHPAFPQAIAWLPGRNDTLLALFALSSFSFLIEYCNRKKILHLLLHIFFLLVACFTKESAIFLPLVFLLYIILWNDKKSGTLKKITENMWAVLFWILIIIFTFVIRKIVLHDTVGMSLSFTITNFFSDLPAILNYIGKMLVPANLSTMSALKDMPVYYGIAVILLVSFLIWRSKTKNIRHIVFGFLWMLIFLAPAILRTNKYLETLFYEHRLYFPMIGFILIMGETDIIKRFQLKNKTSLIIFFAILILFFTTAWIHRGDYRDQYHYWKCAADSSPNSSAALRGLAAYYMMKAEKTDSINVTDKAKNIAEAEKLYIRCIKLNPKIPEVWNALGCIYRDKGETTLAEKYFREEFRNHQNTSNAYHNLGRIKLVQTRYDSAEYFIRKSLEADSTNAVFRNDLALSIAMQERYDEAIKICISILDETPDYEFPKRIINLIFSKWNNNEKVSYYKSLLDKKGITY